jgi:hypothetical protein
MWSYLFTKKRLNADLGTETCQVFNENVIFILKVPDLYYKIFRYKKYG